MTQTITCLALRRALLSDPYIQSASQQHHLAECHACQQYAKQLQLQNQQLLHAIQVPTPEGLADRILLQQHRANQSRPLKRVMLAASLLMALGLASWFLPRHANTTDWAMIAAQHVASEPDALIRRQSVADNALETALAEWGLATQQPLQGVHYLGRCPMPNGTGLHFVFQNPELGTVTIILPPKNSELVVQQAQYGHYYAIGLQKGQRILTVVSDNPLKLNQAADWLNKQMVLL